ncbi:hypothetical protein E1A91_A12G032800v1 [Gossypium mustelinum]|uniref:Uncharacterized protein n=2 Tax=Gossypium mustelinum TaxID=34275 RepID=A0A5D2WR98_GOSMU|nr:hypothetical protein E1A91_A12G032800v1 [Gossypium mustelinum]
MNQRKPKTLRPAMEIQRTFSIFKAFYSKLCCLCTQPLRSSSISRWTETGISSTQEPERLLLLPSIARITFHHQFSEALINGALASATNASTTSLKRDRI